MMSYSQRLGRLQLSAGVGSNHVSHLVASPRTYKKSEDRGEDRMRTTDLRVYPHHQFLPSIIHAVRASVSPSECPVAQNYYTEVTRTPPPLVARDMSYPANIQHTVQTCKFITQPEHACLDRQQHEQPLEVLPGRSEFPDHDAKLYFKPFMVSILQA